MDPAIAMVLALVQEAPALAANPGMPALLEQMQMLLAGETGEPIGQAVEEPPAPEPEDDEAPDDGDLPAPDDAEARSEELRVGNGRSGTCTLRWVEDHTN